MTMTKKQIEAFKKVCHPDPDEKKDLQNIIKYHLEMLLGNIKEEDEGFKYHMILLGKNLKKYFKKYN